MIYIFDDNKYFNINELIVIGEIDGIQDINLLLFILEDNFVIVKCVGIDIKKSFLCFVFNSFLDNFFKL